MSVSIASVLSFRNEGYDENWLKDLIVNNPRCLGLGDIEPITRERQQSSGGRLDILFTSPDDDSMYEVEVMLGETDESHIIRTIEYWDNEKRIRPQRQHFAVLIAENITSRFFNVIRLFSQSIPIIAIQANLLVADGHQCVHFTKILDIHEEVEDGLEIRENYDESYWKKYAPWTIDIANSLLDSIRDIFDSPVVRYVGSYVSITVSGNNYFWFHKRCDPKSYFCFRISDEYRENISKQFDEQNISFVQRGGVFKIKCDVEFIKTNNELLRKIAEYVKNTWQ